MLGQGGLVLVPELCAGRDCWGWRGVMESRFPAAPVAAPGSSLLGESGLSPAGVWSCWLSCNSWVRCLQPCCLPCHIPKVWTAEVCWPVRAEFLPRSLCWWDSQMGFTFFFKLINYELFFMSNNRAWMSYCVAVLLQRSGQA